MDCVHTYRLLGYKSLDLEFSLHLALDLPTCTTPKLCAGPEYSLVIDIAFFLSLDRRELVVTTSLANRVYDKADVCFSAM